MLGDEAELALIRRMLGELDADTLGSWLEMSSTVQSTLNRRSRVAEKIHTQHSEWARRTSNDECIERARNTRPQNGPGVVSGDNP